MNQNKSFKTLLLFAPLLLIFLLSQGCSDEDADAFTIGRNFINPQTSIVMVDSFTLSTSTFILDSFSTTSPDFLLTGVYNDDYFGKTSANAYFQIAIPDSVGIQENAVFDSLTIRLHYSGNVYGDTLQPFTLFVYRVNEIMEEPDEKYFYNTTTFSCDEEPLGTMTFRPRPNYDTDIEIRLSDDLGKELMNFLMDDSDEILSNSNFTEYLNGLVLKCGDNTQSVLSFAATDTLVNLELYTHYTNEERKEVKYYFPLYSEGNYFNNLKADRKGTEIEKLKTRKEEIISAETGNKTFIQAGTGVLTRIDFPSIYRIMEIEHRYIYYKAELIFKPVHQSNAQVPFPKELVLFTTNKYNEPVSQVLDSDDEAVVSEFSFDKQYNEENYYSFDITSFLSDVLADAYVDEENGLVIGFSDDNLKSTLNRVVFDARLTDSYRPMLKMYFIFYE